jgi:predicted acetyltransferase
VRAVPASVEVVEAAIADKVVLSRLLELYRHDFSEFDGADVDTRGLYGYGYLDLYWTEPDRRPFLFRVDGHWAGFALVRAGTPHDMAEFFVMRKYRRLGIGKEAARAVFARFPGDWQVRQMRRNRAATTFWRDAIPVAFEDSVNDEGPVQRFSIAS